VERGIRVEERDSRVEEGSSRRLEEIKEERWKGEKRKD
jgi:hypothetical protein